MCQARRADPIAGAVFQADRDGLELIRQDDHRQANECPIHGAFGEELEFQLLVGRGLRVVLPHPVGRELRLRSLAVLRRVDVEAGGDDVAPGAGFRHDAQDVGRCRAEDIRRAGRLSHAEGADDGGAAPEQFPDGVGVLDVALNDGYERMRRDFFRVADEQPERNPAGDEVLYEILAGFTGAADDG